MLLWVKLDTVMNCFTEVWRGRGGGWRF